MDLVSVETGSVFLKWKAASRGSVTSCGCLPLVYKD